VINRLVSQRYEVLEKIGESPLFTLYKARDKAMNRVVALKAVSPLYADDARFMQGLQSGLPATSRLNHPNITAFYEFGEDDGVPYAISEFVRGINLKERIRRIAPFTLSVAIDIACAVGEALNFAHNLNQVHGDLRPQNIIVSPEGAVKVTDFGIMSGVARSPEAQRETLLRSAPYHAPELSTTQVGTPAADIYALGAVLYEMLTGTPAYSSESLEAIADQHAFAPIPSPRVINPGVPRSIEGIVIKCLQKRPEQRYRSMAEVLTDLKAVRDALRFGKSLSWSPIDLDMPAASAPTAAKTAPQAAVPRPLEPVAAAAASSVIAPPMPSNKNRLRAQDERISIVWKVLIGLMTGVILLLIIGFFAIYTSNWVEPQTQQVTIPEFVGKPLDEVQALADKMHVQLILHGDYMDKPRNLVYKSDQPRGMKIHAGHYINVWYSKGPEYVDVPNVVGVDKEQAEQQLKDAGLVIGKVMPQYSAKIPRNAVVSQNVSYKKRVLHDTAVDLVFSDGPQPEFSDNQSDNSAGDGTGNTNQDATTTPDVNTDAQVPPSTPTVDATDDEQHDFYRTISIPKDGKGKRQVKIEVLDAHVDRDHTPPIMPIDEQRDEGDRVPVSFSYYGKTITMRIYYDDKIVFEKRFDPQDPKNKGRIQ
jgi:eukaryotic-like serine/threonine-protein kinase